MERDLKRYNEAFGQANRDDDASLMLPWMRLPVTRYGNGSIATYVTTEDAEAMYRSMVDRLKGTGYIGSVLSDFDIVVLNPTTAFVRCHAVRQAEGDGIVEEFDAAYLMALTDDRWQVAALISRR